MVGKTANFLTDTKSQARGELYTFIGVCLQSVELRSLEVLYV